MASVAVTTAHAPPAAGRCFDISVSICGPNEIRLKDNCPNANPEIRQKYVTVEPGPEETHWTFPELLDIACFLHDAPEFKNNNAFAKDANLVVNLGWTLVHKHTSREAVVTAMLALMKRWFQACQEDSECIPPPSRSLLQDPQQRKILGAMKALELRLMRAETDAAEKRQTALTCANQPLTVTVDPFQQKLLDHRNQLSQQRISA